MSPVSREHQSTLYPAISTAVVESPPAAAPLPRRSFLTGRVLDPELHPPLRTRVARALGRRTP